MSISESESEINNTSESLNNMSLSSPEKSCYGFKLAEEPSGLSFLDENQEKNPDGFELIELILKSCVPDLSAHLEKCKKAMLINSSLKSLSREDVNELFHDEIGLRGIFMLELKKHQPKTKMAVHNDENCKYKTKPKVTENNKIENVSKEFRRFHNWKKVVSFTKKLIYSLNKVGI